MAIGTRCIVFFCALLLALAPGCYRQDIRTLEVRIPQMRSEACAKIVQEALSRADGILKVELDLPNRRIFVTYNALKTARVNIEYHLTHAGFDANDKPARPEARDRLPPECRREGP